MLKKTTAAVKIYIVFFTDFSVFSGGKSMKNREKNVKTVFVHKNRQKNHVWTDCCLATIQFLMNFWGSPGSPGAARDVPGTSQNRQFLSFMVNFAWKRSRTVPRKVPGSPQRSPGHPQGYIFSRLFDRSCISKITIITIVTPLCLVLPLLLLLLLPSFEWKGRRHEAKPLKLYNCNNIKI